MEVVEIDLGIAIEYGKLRATLLDAGTPMPDMIRASYASSDAPSVEIKA